MNNVIQMQAYKEQCNIENKDQPLIMFVQLVKISNCHELSRHRVDLIMNKTLLNEIEVSISNMFGIMPSLDTSMNFSTVKYKETIHEVLMYAKTLPEIMHTYIENLVQGVSTLLALEQKIPVDENYGHEIFCRYHFDTKYLENNLQLEERNRLDGIFAQRKLNTIIASQNRYVHNNIDQSEKIKLKM